MAESGDRSREWLKEFKDYRDYRQQVLQLKQAMPDRTVQLLTEEEFDRLRWGVGMADVHNYEEHKTLDRRIDALDSRVEGTIGHLYGAGGKGGVLDRIESQLIEMKDEVRKFNGQFVALQIQREQDKAAYEARNVELANDVKNIGNQMRKQGAGWKKFKDAAIGAAAVGAVGLLVAWLRNFGQSVVEVLDKVQGGG